MASSTRVLSRLSSRLQPLGFKITKKTLFADTPLLKSASQSSSRLPCLSRLPVELSSVETMLPLHSAIASARLRSSLSIESQSWGIVPQGISMPL